VSACPRCGKDNQCEFGQAQPCWCVSVGEIRLPLPAAPDAACYCPDCLAALASPSRTRPAEPADPDPAGR
jgi:hypothetical protein